MKRFLSSINFAYSGFLHCLPGGTNFKIQLGLGALIFLLGFALNITQTEWILLIVCSVLVLAFEMMNTAIEKICNLITTDFNPQVKVIKGIAAGAVLLVAIGSAVTGGIIFLPKIFLFIKTWG